MTISNEISPHCGHFVFTDVLVYLHASDFLNNLFAKESKAVSSIFNFLNSFLF